jgi:hypothetical protein
MVCVAMVMLVTVDVPNESKKRLGPPDGKVKPDSSSNGIRTSSTAVLIFSTNSVFLERKSKVTMAIIYFIQS